jgi:small-conductance mechanosensitive channel
MHHQSAIEATPMPDAGVFTARCLPPNRPMNLDSLMRFLRDLHDLDVTLFSFGGTEIHLSTLLKIVAVVILLVWIAQFFRALLLNRLLKRTHLDPGTQQAVGAIVHYAVLVIGIAVALQNAGINLTAFSVVAGALGVGVGFGLQNIFSNFISGLIIMFERPIKVGDRIEIAGVEGTVQSIGARRTTILTNDNITIIVPNQRFITDNVTNLLYSGHRIRVHVPVAVTVGTEARTMERLLLAAAEAHPDVLDDPPPSVRLVSLGGPAMQFELLAWTSSRVNARRQLLSDLNFDIGERLRQHDIRNA